MAEHVVQVGYSDLNRYTNDEPYHADNEYYLLKLLQDNWNKDNSQGITPVFYLTNKEISHDLSTAPAIKVFQNNEDSTAIGLGFIAKRMKLLMNIELLTLDRTLLFDTKEEIVRILDFCRKRPIPEWDFIYTTNIKRMDPRAGNYHIMIQAVIERLVKPIPGTTLFPAEQ